MPSRGDLTWHPPFSGEFSIYYSSPQLNTSHTIIHVYNFLLPDTLLYGILEYRKHLYSFTEKINFSIAVDVDI